MMGGFEGSALVEYIRRRFSRIALRDRGEVYNITINDFPRPCPKWYLCAYNNIIIIIIIYNCKDIFYAFVRLLMMMMDVVVLWSSFFGSFELGLVSTAGARGAVAGRRAGAWRAV